MEKSEHTPSSRTQWVLSEALNCLVGTRKYGFISKLFPGRQAGSFGAHLPLAVLGRSQDSCHLLETSMLSPFAEQHRVDHCFRGYSDGFIPPPTPDHFPCEVWGS